MQSSVVLFTLFCTLCRGMFLKSSPSNIYAREKDKAECELGHRIWCQAWVREKVTTLVYQNGKESDFAV